MQHAGSYYVKESHRKWGCQHALKVKLFLHPVYLKPEKENLSSSGNATQSACVVLSRPVIACCWWLQLNTLRDSSQKQINNFTKLCWPGSWECNGSDKIKFICRVITPHHYTVWGWQWDCKPPPRTFTRCSRCRSKSPTFLMCRLCDVLRQSHGCSGGHEVLNVVVSQHNSLGGFKHHTCDHLSQPVYGDCSGEGLCPNVI